MTLAELAQGFIQEQRLLCQMLEDEQISSMAVAAARFYAAYGHLSLPTFKEEKEPSTSPIFDFFAAAFADSVSVIDPLHQIGANKLIPQPTCQPLPPIPFDQITESTDVTVSDWGVIKPLFMLYCEREQALVLEASRIQGVDVFGRSSSEIQQDITAYEAELPQKAFIQPAFTV